MSRRALIVLFILPAILLAAGSVVFLTTDLDLQIQRKFYFESTGAWFRNREQPWRFFYKFGAWPAVAVAIVSFCVFVLGLGSTRFAALRKVSAFLLLLFVLGPILLARLVRMLWGRPSPDEVIEFRGSQEFEPLLAFHASSLGPSFPSFAATLGFYFFAGTLLLFASGWRALGLLSLLLAAAFGTCNGIAHLAAGENFASDILWAGGLMWLIAAGLFHALRMPRAILYRPEATATFVPKWAPPCALLLLGMISLAWPNSDHFEPELLPDGALLPDTVTLTLDLQGTLEIARGDQLALETESRGFGLPGSHLECTSTINDTGTVLTQTRRGYFTKLNVNTRLTLPSNRVYKIKVGRGVSAVAIHPPPEFDPSDFAHVQLSLFPTTALPNLESEVIDEDFLGRKIRGFSF